MKKTIVCTTINGMTPALTALAELCKKDSDLTMVIVQDKNSKCICKHDFGCDRKNVDLLTTTKQIQKQYKSLSDMLGWNTVDRRNIGFLHAYNTGADVVCMMDDDNIPLDNWGHCYIGKDTIVDVYEQSSVEVFDPLSVFWNGCDYDYPWHRGYPIHLAQKREDHNGECFEEVVKPMIQASLWNGEIDIDACQRMQGDDKITFPSIDIPFTSNKTSPFNMQNTWIHRSIMKWCPSIPNTGRMCDIWGAYYCQAMSGAKVIYTEPDVLHTQKRTWDSLVYDMQEELLGYKFPHFAELITNGATTPKEYLCRTLKDATRSHESFDFVCAYEESFNE